MNMLQTIVPKSDQLNADDLIGQSITIKVTEVRFKGGDDQPVAIHFDGDSGKPYKPCKSMRRVLVQAWGADANKYLGRSMALVRDPEVKWAGQAVGGIRITHLSHIEEPLTMALTATRGSRKPYTVDVLEAGNSTGQSQEAMSAEAVASVIADYGKCNGEQYKELEKQRRKYWAALPKAQQDAIESAKKSAFNRLAAAAKAQNTATSVNHETWIATLKGQTDPAQLEESWAKYLDQCASAGVETHPDAEDAYRAVKTLLGKQS